MRRFRSVGKQEARIKQLESALAFYADPDTYFAIAFIADQPCGDFVDDVSKTLELGMKPGRRAREVLGWEGEV